MTSSLKEALQMALEKARNTPAQMPPPPAPTAAQDIPDDWDDEGGAKEIKETSTTKTENAMNTNPAYYFQPTNNVSRETFNYVRDNPGCTRVQAMDALVARGFNPRSISALLSQMQIQGMLRGGAQTGYWVTIEEYRPIKTAKTFKNRQAVKQAKKEERKKIVITRRAKAKVEEPQPTLEEKKAVLRGGTAWSPQQVLDGLSVVQARAVYDELRKIFNA